MTQDEINAVKKAAEKMRKQESAQDEIIEMAKEAHISAVFPVSEKSLVRFANLVAAKAFQNGYEKGIAAFNEAVSLEREACMNVLRGLNYAQSSKYDCMDAIRARGEA